MSESESGPESPGGPRDVAFRNPDGSIVVLAVDDDWGTDSQRFDLRVGSRAFSYELPAGAVATFALPNSP
jgi:glucosylceramidase